MQFQSLVRALSLSAALAISSSLFASHASAGDLFQPSHVCNLDTLKGHYATLIQGAYGPGTTPGVQTSGPSTPFQGIQMLNFDGKGNITGTEELVAGGYAVTEDSNNAPSFVPVTGNYKVNQDCTGTAYITSSHNGVAVNFVFVGMVISNGGKNFYMLVVPPYDGAVAENGPGVVRTISSIGTRVEQY